MDLRTFAGHRHHGPRARSDAARLGISKSAWYRAIDSGLLEPLYPNVARLPGAAATRSQRALAAVWAVGAGALASHRTSAALWGIERPDDDPIEVLIASRQRCVAIPGVVVHRPRDLVDLRPIVRDQVPTTMPARMLLDLAAVDPDRVLDGAIQLLAARTVSPAGLRAALMRHAVGRNVRLCVLDFLADERMPVDSEGADATLLANHRCHRDVSSDRDRMQIDSSSTARSSSSGVTGGEPRAIAPVRVRPHSAG
jgi:hypothetical protein